MTSAHICTRTREFLRLTTWAAAAMICLTAGWQRAAGAGENDGQKAQTRQLVFPSQFSLGQLFIYTPRADEKFPLDCDGIVGGAGQYVGDARGKLSVPWSKNAQLYLSASVELVSHPEVLSTLDATTFDGIGFGKVSLAASIDKCMAPLAHLTGLRRLDIEVADLTDKQLARLTPLTNLEGSTLSGNALSGECFKDLKTWSKLKDLDLRLNPLTESGYTYIGQLNSLKTLHVSRCGANDLAIIQLSKLKDLESLDVGQSHITAQSLSLLKNMKNLRSLNLTGTNLSAKDLTVLSGSNLKVVYLGSKFSYADAQLLKKALPSIRVVVANHARPLDNDTNTLFAPLHY